MPINYDVEFPKLQRENFDLRLQLNQLQEQLAAYQDEPVPKFSELVDEFWHAKRVNVPERIVEAAAKLDAYMEDLTNGT
jgi:cell division septum initiation protein DivIVA